MPVLFSATLFLSAALLFFIELMFGSMILPKFGGTPAVWNTCMLFFQAAMLAGYSYAHWAPEKFGVRKHLVIHLILLLLPLLFLPIAVKFDPPGEGNPVLWLLIILAVSVGVPFFMISTTNPLLSMWFTETGHPSARDPYFLYAASNVGSMLALFIYPLVPTWMLNGQRLGLYTQSLIWSGGYLILLGMIGACAYAVYKAPPVVVDEKKKQPQPRSAGGTELIATPPKPQRIAWWVALAFVPSSLMLGVTTYLSTDLSPGPLIWVFPLGIYLLSFILVFSRIPPLVHMIMILSLPVVVLLQTYLMLSDTTQSKQVLISLHLLTLFVVAMVCHGELANNRPDPKYLTAFYLWMSVGGVLGGLFNALVAPVVFKTIAEYPLVMAISCLLLPTLDIDNPGRWKLKLMPIIVGMLAAAALFRIPSEIIGAIKRLYEASPDVVAEQNLMAKLLARVLFVLPVLALIGAGKLTYDWLKRSAPEINVTNFFLASLLVGMAIGAAIQLPPLLLANDSEWYTPSTTLRWWFEMPLAMVLLCMLLPHPAWESNPRLLYALDAVAALTLALVIGMHLNLVGDYSVSFANIEWMTGKVQGFLSGLHHYVPELCKTLRLPRRAPDYDQFTAILQFGLPILFIYAWVTRPVRFGLGLGAILLAAAVYNITENDYIKLRERSFFGTLKLERSWSRGPDNEKVYYHRLVHGTTLHGKQQVEELDKEVWRPKHDAEPLTYYHQTGPLGQVFAMLNEGELDPETRKPIKPAEPFPAALIGLGTGTTASYSKPGQEFVFYEIDAKVKAIAENENYFSYLSDAKERGAKLDFVMGDARLSLAKDPATDPQGRKDGHFRLIVVDAFSSDAIPVHLITWEALELYVKKLAPNGVIAFHISNRYLDLEPVLATLAKKAELKCLVRHDSKEDKMGKAASTWVILARNEKAFGSILDDVKDTEKGRSCHTRIEEARGTLRYRKGNTTAEKSLEEAQKELSGISGNWYWVQDRKYFRDDALEDVELWTDDYQNILAIFMW